MDPFDDDLKRHFSEEAARLAAPPVDPAELAGRTSRARRVRSASRATAALAGIVAVGIVVGGVVRSKPPVINLVNPSPNQTSSAFGSSSGTPTASASPKAIAPAAKKPSSNSQDSELSTIKPDHGPGMPVVSGNGRFVAFIACPHAQQDELCALPDGIQVFVYDRQSNKSEVVSVTTAGEMVGGESPAISEDGRYVAFYSSSQVYVRDRLKDTLIMASVSSEGEPQNQGAFTPVAGLSDDGRFVVFNSESDNLAPGTTKGPERSYVHDMVTGDTTIVPVGAWPKISGNGRIVVLFREHGIYVYDRMTDETTLAIPEGNGQFSGGFPYSMHISDDGRYLAFASSSSDLTATPDDDGEGLDSFVLDRTTGIVAEISSALPDHVENVAPGGIGQGYAYVCISGDGAAVVFAGPADEILHDLSAGTDQPIGARSSYVGLSRNGSVLVSMGASEQHLFATDLTTGATEKIL